LSLLAILAVSDHTMLLGAAAPAVNSWFPDLRMFRCSYQCH
jgi:hypothetical protein